MDATTENVIGSLDSNKNCSAILIIDNSENSRSLLKRRITIYGYDVKTAGSAEEAINNLNSEKIDVIFLEYNLPDIGGFDFLRKLKSSREYINIPVIVISSDNDVEKSVQCIEIGAEDYLVKPLNPTILKARLENSIAKKRAHDAEVTYIAEMKENQRQIIEKEKMASLGNMAMAISQELKNPLNVVTNLSDISCDLCRELGEKIASCSGKLPEIVVQDIGELIKNIQLDIKKISEHGKKADKILRFMIDQSTTAKAEFYYTNLNKIVAETVKMLISDYKAANKEINAKIELKLDNKVPEKLFLSAQAINQALYNLIDNAIYSLNNKTYDEDWPLINIKTKNYDEFVEISVYDNGIGIDKGLTRVIFEPFFTTKKDGKGPGLGLSAVSEAVVQLHKGSVKVNSEPNKFAEFILTIPKII